MLKINWFSPLPPAKTSIAEFSYSVLHKLCVIADVTIWTDQAIWNADIEKIAPVKHFNPLSPAQEELTNAINIYNIGNNPSFHGGIWQMSRRYPGIVILHDTHLQYFFVSFYTQQNKKEEYLQKMFYYYGEQGKIDAEKFLNGELNTDYIAEHYPLTELAIESTLGVVVHTRQALMKLSEKYNVVYSPLSHVYTNPLPSTNASIGSSPQKIEKPYKLIIFGYIGRNRRLESVLKGLARYSNKKIYLLDVYGNVENKVQIDQMVNELELSEQIRFHGFVSDDILDEALSSADLAINLRYPTMGEASLSQLRSWAFALPCMVSKIGWYAELPEEAVSFISIENEIADIIHILEEFALNPLSFKAKGIAGFKTLIQNHSPVVYAKSIISFCNSLSHEFPKKQESKSQLSLRINKPYSVLFDITISAVSVFAQRVVRGFLE